MRKICIKRIQRKKDKKSKKPKKEKIVDIDSICDNCSGKEGLNKNVKIEPIGSTTPEIYFVKGSIRLEEDEENTLCSDNEGRFCKRSILECGFTKGRIRIGSVVRCLSQTWESKYKAPYDTHIKKCSHLLHLDIQNTNPKILIASGSEALQALTVEKELLL